MTNSIEWWADQPAAVRGVIDLANTEDNAAIVAAFCPAHADTIATIGELLVRIDALEAGDVDLVRDMAGARVSVIHIDDVADEYAAQDKAEVLLMAQLVASLLPMVVAA